MAVDQRRTRVFSWSVGELSRASGLSARMLRHWEDLGLLTADRSPHGHRRYGPGQVTRLYRALALRRTGLGLRQIAALLDEQDPDPVTTLRAHVAELQEDLRRRGELHDRLAGVLASLEDTCLTDGGEDRQAQVLMKVIETMTMFEHQRGSRVPGLEQQPRGRSELLVVPPPDRSEGRHQLASASSPSPGSADGGPRQGASASRATTQPSSRWWTPCSRNPACCSARRTPVASCPADRSAARSELTDAHRYR